MASRPRRVAAAMLDLLILAFPFSFSYVYFIRLSVSMQSAMPYVVHHLAYLAVFRASVSFGRGRNGQHRFHFVQQNEMTGWFFDEKQQHGRGSPEMTQAGTISQ